MILTELEVGKTAFIKKLSGDIHFVLRMNTLGMAIGRKVRVIKYAPFNGPVLVECLSAGNRAMIDLKTASMIQVEVLD